MAVRSVCWLFSWVIISTSVFLCTASPTRRQFVSITETTSSDPAEVVTDDGAVWDDTDEFDLDGDEDWLNEAMVVSPSSSPQQSDYEDYDDDDDYSARRSGNVVVDLGDEDDDDVVHQDAEEDNNGNEAEFLFLPSRDNRLLLQDDDDQGGPIKVRHTGKNSYSDILDTDNSKEGKGDSNRQFEFTIDNDDDDDEKDNEVDDDNGDFVLDESQQKDNNNVESVPRHEAHDDDDEDDDDGEFAAGEDGNGYPLLDNPDEDSQVIYGDHVFLY